MCVCVYGHTHDFLCLYICKITQQKGITFQLFVCIYKNKLTHFMNLLKTRLNYMNLLTRRRHSVYLYACLNNNV